MTTDPDFRSDPSVELQAPIELVEEAATFSKRLVETGTVSVRVETEEVEESVQGELASFRVIVDRVPVDRIVDDIPETRTKDGVTIVPVFEEVLIVERRIRLVEELHIRHEAASETVRVPVTVRKQTAIVDRRPAGQAPPHLSDKESKT